MPEMMKVLSIWPICIPPKPIIIYPTTLCVKGGPGKGVRDHFNFCNTAASGADDLRTHIWEKG